MGCHCCLRALPVDEAEELSELHIDGLPRVSQARETHAFIHQSDKQTTLLRHCLSIDLRVTRVFVSFCQSASRAGPLRGASHSSRDERPSKNAYFII